jgi:gp16 family phage-associated protein
MTKTAQQVKDEFEARGETLASWARKNGYTPRKVYRVTGELDKAKYGVAHEIAVKLGMKADPNQPTA